MTVLDVIIISVAGSETGATSIMKEKEGNL